MIEKDLVEDPKMLCDSSIQCIDTKAVIPSHVILILLLIYVSLSLPFQYSF